MQTLLGCSQPHQRSREAESKKQSSRAAEKVNVLTTKSSLPLSLQLSHLFKEQVHYLLSNKLERIHDTACRKLTSQQTLLYQWLRIQEPQGRKTLNTLHQLDPHAFSGIPLNHHHLAQ